MSDTVRKAVTLQDLKSITDYVFEIEQSFRSDMRVPARVYTTREMLDDIVQDRSLVQLVNTATLPGIQKYAFAMPDIHQGYGFPIGGVVATAIDQQGIISPGGIGYDINCGVRLLVADMLYDELEPYMEELATALYRIIPSGVGQGGAIKLDAQSLDAVLSQGAREMVARDYGNQEDLIFCEEEGAMSGADPALVSVRAKQRGADQLGTLGSGNHFLEVQRVDEIYDESVAKAFGLEKNNVTIMIHCGSRGLGHQVCTDYVRRMMDNSAQYGYDLPDRELVCAPFLSNDGQEYFSAMSAAANFAWANRHTIGHFVRTAWQSVLGKSHSLKTIYDVSHNIGKKEQHTLEGVDYNLLVHRKGATRAFGPSRSELPAAYQAIGQPVFVPGTMGTASYILVGTDESMNQAFGSCCHGAGRTMSRSKAKKTVQGPQLRKELEARGIIIRSDSYAGLAEEAPIAYKDVTSVIEVVKQGGLARVVARVTPLAVVKGG